MIAKIVLLMQRPRRAGDLAFAMLFLVLALFLALNIDAQTTWVKRTKLFSQPAFWPIVSISGMLLFGALHMLGSLLSNRSAGRYTEMVIWLRAVEFPIWFMAYVFATPIVGYLPATLIFTASLSLRMGLRSKRFVLASLGFGLFVVVLFKTLLQVKIPGGMIYEYLPQTARNFMILNF